MAKKSDIDHAPTLFKKDQLPEEPPPGKKLVCCKSKMQNGKRIFASDYGLKAFCFYVNA